MAGVVESVGQSVKQLQPGDKVFGETHKGMQQAATVPTAGMIAVNNLKDRLWQPPGQRVLVNGAAGGVGSMVLQIAKANGATVTGVDHTSKLSLVQELGADQVIDYTEQSVIDGAGQFDLIVDVASTLALSDYKRILSPDGVYVVIPKAESMQRLCELIGSGQLAPMVDKVFPLESVSEALAYLVSGQAVGRVVIMP